MRVGNKSALFNRNGCVSRYGIYAYTRNKLSPAEKAMVEEHLGKCQLCSEAIKGYVKYHHPVLFKNDLHFLSKRIRERYKHEEKEQKRSLLFMAFVIISIGAILALVYLLYKYYEVSF